MTADCITLYDKSYTYANIQTEADEYIRLEAASQGFALKILVNDKSALVRSTVARIKYGHEQLAKDPSWKVRATVAKHCQPIILKDLIHDENHFVRYIIVKRGYFLEHFTSDSDEEIAALAKYQLSIKDRLPS
ncbi:MAG: hypothetical protein IBX55_05040 [Methyloprofundus sp.]|nr:hypothetical protein [Methyloprofundus sp.]MBW6453579.1 hypothetical protein [Methyloprofundus sp.]